MEKYGILCAGDTELAPFFKIIRPCKITEKAMLKFYEGKIGKSEAVAVCSGVCKVNAAAAAQLLIDCFEVTALINSGTAGGMDKGVQLFDTIVSEKLIYHDVAEDILTEFHPFLTENCFKSDGKLLAAARRYAESSDFPVLFGATVTGEQFIENEDRDKINRKYSPLSADMESAAAAHVCYLNGIPFLSVRTVTDTAEHNGLSNFEKNCEAASARAAEITAAVIIQLQEQQAASPY